MTEPRPSRLRGATVEDVDLMAAVHTAAFAALAEAPWSAGTLLRMLRTAGGFGIVAASEPCQGLDGFVLARAMAGDAEILTLAVAPGGRRKGTGRALLRAAMAEGARRRAEAMFLEVADDNPAAVALYVDSGFCEVGRRTGYYTRTDGRRADARILRSSLDAPR